MENNINKNVVEKIVEKINQKIERLEKKFAETHRFDDVANAELDGMIDMLKIVTGKDYYYNETGLHER